jgi:hypothetical protein
MGNNRFCTLVLGEDGQLYRPLVRGGYQPSYGRFLPAGNERILWTPGRVANIHFDGRPSGKRRRPTHPEDRVVRGDVRVARRIIGLEILKTQVRPHTHSVLYDLFPGISVDWQKAFYIDHPELERSAGYLRVREIRVVMEGAPGHEEEKVQVTIWHNAQRIYLPIKDPELLAQVREGRITVGQRIPGSVIFVGLANPFLYKKTDEMRAYLQLLHVLP